MGDVEHEELSRVRRQLADLEQLSEVGFWELDLATGLVEWSSGLRRLYGVGDDTVIDYEGWLAMVHPDDRAMVSATIEAALERHGAYGFDHRLLRSDDGALRWTRCRGRVAVGADGAANSVFGISIDTTDEHRLAQLQADFIANAAHELRTPASAIAQAVDALLHWSVGEGDRAQLLAALHRQSQRLRQLTVNLLDLSAIDEAPAATLLESVALADAVEHALVASGLTGATVDVEAGLAARADAVQLEQVLANLLSNALRYGGPHVSIAGRRAGGRVVLEVHDDGEGVPESIVADLFAPFRRGPQRHPEASGLGLAIVERIMHRFGGNASYRGGHGEGATFRLDFEPA